MLFGIFGSAHTLASLTSRKNQLEAKQAQLNARFVTHRDDITSAVQTRYAIIADIKDEITQLQAL